MRRLICCIALASGCASPGTPPGGPIDEDAPAIVRTRPDTNALNVRSGSIGFDFDEVISERAQGTPLLADLFLISPSKGRNQLSWRRTRLEVAPRGGFKPNTTYRVTMLPGLTDLDGNVDSVGRTVVFSTGPALATGSISGRVFDWMEERPARAALVEAIVLPDSLRYLAVADSLGHYELHNLPAGQYVLRGLVDQNKNREIDLRELYDTLTVTLRDTMSRELHAIPRDTLGPGIERVEVTDSLTIRVKFDRALDTSLVITPGLFTLKTRDSALVALRSVLGRRADQRRKDDSARAKAVQDSVRAASDTSRRDSARVTRPAPAAAAAAAAARATAARAAANPRGRGQVPVDTTPPPKPKVRIPEIEVVIQLEAPLPPNTGFRLRAEGMKSVVGRARSSERTFATPKARPAADSTKPDSTKRDSTRRDSTKRDTTQRDTTTRKPGWIDARQLSAGGPPREEDRPIPAPLRHLFIPAPTTFPHRR